MTEDNAQVDGGTPEGSDPGAGDGKQTEAAVYYPDKYKTREDELAAIKADRTRAKMLQSVLGDDVDEKKLKEIFDGSQILDQLDESFASGDNEKILAGFQRLCDIFSIDEGLYLKGESKVTEEKKKPDATDAEIGDDDYVSGKQVNKIIARFQGQIEADRAAHKQEMQELKQQLDPVFQSESKRSLRERHGELADDPELDKIAAELDRAFKSGEVSPQDIRFLAAAGKAIVSGKITEKLKESIATRIAQMEKERKLKARSEPAGTGAGGGGGSKKLSPEDIYRKAMGVKLGKAKAQK